MDPLPDDIVVTDSHDLDDDSMLSGGMVQKEDEGASSLALASQGISIVHREEITASIEPRDELTEELMSEGGIEIIPYNDEESDL